MKKIMVEGHRGYCARYPENTLVSYRAAVDAHVDAIEFDVWLSSDKEPVIMHDGNVFRTTNGTGHLREMTLAEIKELDAGSKFSPAFAGERVPTLRETLEVICSDPHICPGVEIKEYTEETVDLTIAMLKEFGCLERSFSIALTRASSGTSSSATACAPWAIPRARCRNSTTARMTITMR